MTEYSIHNMTTAMCLWEEVLRLRAEREDSLADYFITPIGVVAAREIVAEFAPKVDTAWDNLPEELKDASGCFDWEVVPRLLSALLGEPYWWVTPQHEVNCLMLEAANATASF